MTDIYHDSRRHETRYCKTERGDWRLGRSRSPSDNLRTELGWEKLTTRKRIHRLILYHKPASPEHGTPDTSLLTSRHKRNTQERKPPHANQSSNHHIPARISFSHRISVERVIKNNKAASSSRFQKLVVCQTTVKPSRYFSLKTIQAAFSHQTKNGLVPVKRPHVQNPVTETPMCFCVYPQGDANNYLHLLMCKKRAFNEACYSTTFSLSYIATSVKYQVLPNLKSCRTTWSATTVGRSPITSKISCLALIVLPVWVKKVRTGGCVSPAGCGADGRVSTMTVARRGGWLSVHRVAIC